MVPIDEPSDAPIETPAKRRGRFGRRPAWIRRQLVRRGIDDVRVLDAMASVRREAFLAETQRSFAYEDSALPIGSGQTISQPFVVALMAQALALPERAKVLEIGTGSGYGAAVLARLADRVWTVERHEELARIASERLAGEGVDNVEVVVADGTLGLEDRAPFHGICVTARAPRVPDRLAHQLADRGRMVVPVASGPTEDLLAISRQGDGFQQVVLGQVRFVPLVGADGYAEP